MNSTQSHSEVSETFVGEAQTNERKDWTARRKNSLLLWQAIASALVTLMILLIGH